MNIEDDAVEVIDIPQFTKDEFLYTDKPYDWLMQIGTNPFILGQLVQRMKDFAATVGVRTFMSLWKDYQKMIAHAEDKAIDNTTRFSDQPVELYCGEYDCTDEGIKYTNRFGLETIVCRHPILVSRRYVNVDTGEEKLEVDFARAGVWKRPIICDRSTLADSRKILELSANGVAVDSENAKELVKYITYIENRNYDKLGETQSVGRLGWIEGHGFSPYVEGLQFDGDVSFRQMFNAVKEKGTLQDWLDTVRPGRQNSQVVRIMLAASFASVLVKPLGVLPFFCHVWGGTEAGKTVGLMVATSVWADPAQGEYYKTFNSTTVHMELLASFCNSLPLCFDELQIIKDRQDFDKTIYMLAEGISKGRGLRTGGIQKVYSWSNCIITTGEMPISNARSGGGAVNRIIEVDCKDERLFTEPRAMANGVRKAYGTAGHAFIDKLLEPDMVDQATDLYNAYYAELNDGDVTEKQAMAGALLLTADKLSNDWIYQDGLTIDQKTLREFLSDKDEVNVNKRAMAWLLDFLAVNGNHFATREDSSVTEVWGEISDGNGKAYIISSIFDAKMNEAGFNANSFKSWAASNGLLETDGDKKRLTKRKQIKGTRVLSRCVCINLQTDEPAQLELYDVTDQDDDLPFKDEDSGQDLSDILSALDSACAI